MTAIGLIYRRSASASAVFCRLRSRTS